eukprot:15004493-Ditylum_brightwellii.AAC.1
MCKVNDNISMYAGMWIACHVMHKTPRGTGTQATPTTIIMDYNTVHNITTGKIVTKWSKAVNRNEAAVDQITLANITVPLCTMTCTRNSWSKT